MIYVDPHVIDPLRGFLHAYKLQCEREVVEALAIEAQESQPQIALWLRAKIAHHPRPTAPEPEPANTLASTPTLTASDLADIVEHAETVASVTKEDPHDRQESARRDRPRRRARA